MSTEKISLTLAKKLLEQITDYEWEIIPFSTFVECKIKFKNKKDFENFKTKLSDTFQDYETVLSVKGNWLKYTEAGEKTDQYSATVSVHAPNVEAERKITSLIKNLPPRLKKVNPVVIFDHEQKPSEKISNYIGATVCLLVNNKAMLSRNQAFNANNIAAVGCSLEGMTIQFTNNNPYATAFFSALNEKNYTVKMEQTDDNNQKIIIKSLNDVKRFIEETCGYPHEYTYDLFNENKVKLNVNFFLEELKSIGLSNESLDQKKKNAKNFVQKFLTLLPVAEREALYGKIKENASNSSNKEKPSSLQYLREETNFFSKFRRIYGNTTTYREILEIIAQQKILKKDEESQKINSTVMPISGEKPIEKKLNETELSNLNSVKNLLEYYSDFEWNIENNLLMPKANFKDKKEVEAFKNSLFSQYPDLKAALEIKTDKVSLSSYNYSCSISIRNSNQIDLNQYVLNKAQDTFTLRKVPNKAWSKISTNAAKSIAETALFLVRDKPLYQMRNEIYTNKVELLALVDCLSSRMTLKFKNKEYAEKLSNALKKVGYKSVEFSKIDEKQDNKEYNGSVTLSNLNEVKRFIEETCGYPDSYMHDLFKAKDIKLNVIFFIEELKEIGKSTESLSKKQEKAKNFVQRFIKFLPVELKQTLIDEIENNKIPGSKLNYLKEKIWISRNINTYGNILNKINKNETPSSDLALKSYCEMSEKEQHKFIQDLSELWNDKNIPEFKIKLYQQKILDVNNVQAIKFDTFKNTTKYPNINFDDNHNDSLISLFNEISANKYTTQKAYLVNLFTSIKNKEEDWPQYTRSGQWPGGVLEIYNFLKNKIQDLNKVDIKNMKNPKETKKIDEYCQKIKKILLTKQDNNFFNKFKHADLKNFYKSKLDKLIKIIPSPKTPQPKIFRKINFNQH